MTRSSDPNPSGSLPPRPSAGAPAPRCVLWAPPGRPLTPGLVASFHKRGVRTDVCADSFRVLALAAMATRPTAEARGTGSAGGEGAIVVICEPMLIDGGVAANELADALARYAPRATCWWSALVATGDSARPARAVLAAVTPLERALWSMGGARAAVPATAEPKMPAPVNGPALAAATIGRTHNQVAAPVSPMPASPMRPSQASRPLRLVGLAEPGPAPLPGDDIDRPMGAAGPTGEQATLSGAITPDELAMLLGQPISGSPSSAIRPPQHP